MNQAIAFMIGFLLATAIFWRPALLKEIADLKKQLRKTTQARDYWFAQAKRTNDDWWKE